MEKATYKINDVEYTQEFLTINQTIELTEEIQGLSFGEKVDPISIIKTLRSSGKLERLLNLILDGPEPVSLDRVKLATLVRIVGDFFSLNELLDVVSTIVEIMSELNGSEAVTLLQKIPGQKSSTGTS